MKVLVVSTSKKTHGGISSVIKLYEQSKMWQSYHCRWIGTHRDGSIYCKLWYLLKGFAEYILLLPFYDIVHFHISLGATAHRKYPFFVLAKLLRKKTVIHLHCGTQIDEIWDGVYQKLFDGCDCAIVLSESLKKCVEKYIGSTYKVKVVYNPCPPVPLKEKYEKCNHILYSGTLNESKGYKDLLRAFTKIKCLYPEWKLVIAGNGEIKEAKKLIEELGLSNQVSLLGWVDGDIKHKAYREAKVFCLPSYAEGFPMAVLDAWAYGLPVVTTPVGGIPDVAKDGENMLLFTPGDLEALAFKLDVIIKDNKLRSRLSLASRSLSENRFNLTTITNQVASIYEYIIKN